MIKFYSLKHAAKTTGKLTKCADHENGKILRSINGSPLLLKENNNSILNTHVNYPDSFPAICPSTYFSDNYQELPSGTTVIFTQTSLGEVTAKVSKPFLSADLPSLAIQF